MSSRRLNTFRSLGPGLIMAAAGIGAGDVVVASVTGIRFGSTLLWAIALTAFLKFVLTEALGRWQLATGETVVRAWVTRLPRPIAYLLAAYLLLWGFMVGASLSSACGLAGNTLFPQLTVQHWGVIHALAAALMVAGNRFSRFQRVMKILIGVMAVSVLLCAVLAAPSALGVLKGLVIPSFPPDGGAAVLALLGGIGGSVTVVCYGYWLRAADWSGSDRLPHVRADVKLAYVFTGLFGIALCVIAAGVHAEAAKGTRIALEIAQRLETVAGRFGRWVFLIGFWSTVFTAMMGVWQGVPSIFAELIETARQKPTTPKEHRRYYLSSLAYLAGPPLLLLWFNQPIAVVMTFSIVGAFFMPFLAGTLLYLNNQRKWMGSLANRWPGNLGLTICLLAFGVACIRELATLLKLE
ncbi:MAG TPA: Nramp family divalent metal transporter [Opitutaceae bacterium]|nr:Nramp family divalent metal transporter [Opitutaceae bacterium]